MVDKRNSEKEISVDWRYDLENIDRSYNDKRLVKINLFTGEKEIIIESLNNKVSKELLLELFSVYRIRGEKNIVIDKARLLFQEDDIENFWEDFSLEKFSFLKESEKLFFQLVYPTDIPFPNLISYDPNTQKLQVMKINSYYRDGFHKQFLSPDGKFLLAPSGFDLSQKLWLFNLEKDTAQLLTQLSENETFDQEIEGAFHIRWLNNKTVEYTIYNQSSSAINKSLIEVRKVVIE